MPVASPAGGVSAEYVFRGPELRRLTAEQFADSLSEITGQWRVLVPSSVKPASYVREWQVVASPLTRALGRPIRDQVFTERNNEATTLQGLEMVNGETLTHMLHRGAERMLGVLKSAPKALYDSGQLQGGDHSFASFGIDITGARELYLLVSDRGSYSPELVRADWAGVELVSANGTTPLGALKPVAASGVRSDTDPIEFRKENFADGLRATAPSTVVYDISGRGFTRIRGTVGLEKSCMRSDISPAVRFFVFDNAPDPERLVEVSPETPIAPVPHYGDLIERIFLQALGRLPTPAERGLANAALAKQPVDGLADLLWSVAMLPEFQLIH
jgi:hypothetical protein